jgi:hypothetical protein
VREDIARFVDTTSRPVADWRADLVDWARVAFESAAELESIRPGENDDLLATAFKVLNAMEAPAMEGAEFPRHDIARACSYLHATARLCADHDISPFDADAMDAARVLAHAAVQVLIGMDGDYGDAGKAPE